jgi:hypothetical protein
MLRPPIPPPPEEEGERMTPNTGEAAVVGDTERGSSNIARGKKM